MNIAMPQVTCALVWAAQNVSELGGDASRVAVLGGSAGANLALSATYAATDMQYDLPCKGAVPKISAVAGLVPAVDPESVFNNTDPIMRSYDQQLVHAYIGGEPANHPDRVKAVQVKTYISPLAPPTMIVGHKNDHIVPIASIRDFVRRARKAQVDVTYKEVIWADHTTPLLTYNPMSQAIRLQVLKFFRAWGM